MEIVFIVTPTMNFTNPELPPAIMYGTMQTHDLIIKTIDIKVYDGDEYILYDDIKPLTKLV